MRRDTSELAHGSLFIEKINQTFSAADDDLLPDRDADAVCIAGALPNSPIRHGFAGPGKVPAHGGREVAATPENPRSPIILRIDNLYFMSYN